MNSVQRQLRYSVSSPPSSSPTAAPEPATAPNTANAVARSLASGNVVVSRDSAAGASVAPAMPWIARAMTSTAKLGEMPPSSEAPAKTKSPMMNIRFRPTRSARRPPNSSSAPKASE